MLNLLLTGAAGFLGREILDLLASTPDVQVTTAGRSHPDTSPRHVHLDLTHPEGFSRAFRTPRPDVLIHAAAMADVRVCEREPALATCCNTTATAHLASRAANLGSSLVLISTDQVFDGKGSWYAEDAPIGPVNVYGRTKADAEEAVRRTLPEAAVIRLALVVGPSRAARPSGSDQVLRALQDGQTPTLFTDEFRTPIHVTDAARMIVEVALAPARPPLLHLAGPERISRYELGCCLAAAAGLNAARIKAATHDEVQPWPIRPADVSLDTSLLQSWTAHPPRPLSEAVRAC